MAETEAWVMIPKLDKDKTGCVIDMRPLVLCKDCKNGKPGDCGYGIDCDDVWHDDYWFCADGEKLDYDG